MELVVDAQIETSALAADEPVPIALRLDADRCSGTARLTMANFSCLLGAFRSFQLSAGAVP